MAKQIEAKNAPAVLCVTFPFIYRQKRIVGAKFAGPGSKPDGIRSLEITARMLPRDAELVIYCGCCPMQDCPNVRPAYEKLKQMEFRAVRVLNLPTNLHTDWIAKGYPTEQLQTARNS